MPAEPKFWHLCAMEGKSACNKVAIYFMINFRELCLITLSLPLSALFICFITAYIFQQDEIHETHCKVYNVIPSISAITGISPQRYLWRVCVAFHMGPRVVIGLVYRAHYRALLAELPAELAAGGGAHAQRLLDACFWLYLVEVAAVCGVTYVSNRENYPVHEKFFILFMMSSVGYMVATVKISKLLRPAMTATEHTSYVIKKCLLAVTVLSALGLLLFFLKHRLLCHEMAFSWFSLCEYIIATANMAFHVTVMLDFPTEKLVVAREGRALAPGLKAE
ncbi:post-GPI attachment to proteins factor 2-like [Bacillus rossius redtenbacheri]|uniref:post-GPI attachment to proteins factor 2-like n=1 Tax=Bacillus rossius redtenbacheri TaxID=93214 RepID=UPI002FDD041E